MAKKPTIDVSRYSNPVNRPAFLAKFIEAPLCESSLRFRAVKDFVAEQRRLVRPPSEGVGRNCLLYPHIQG
jgi:hypothetical protein